MIRCAAFFERKRGVAVRKNPYPQSRQGDAMFGMERTDTASNRESQKQ
jgi:hypothetical protein